MRRTRNHLRCANSKADAPADDDGAAGWTADGLWGRWRDIPTRQGNPGGGRPARPPWAWPAPSGRDVRGLRYRRRPVRGGPDRAQGPVYPVLFGGPDPAADLRTGGHGARDPVSHAGAHDHDLLRGSVLRVLP